MAFLSDRATTTNKNGYIHIIIPNAGSPTGFDSFRISYDDFVDDLVSSIDDVQTQSNDNANDILELSHIGSRSQYQDRGSAFQHVQSAKSLIYRIIARGDSDTCTLKIGTTLGGSEIDEITFETEYNLKYMLEPGLDLWSDSIRTIYFTPSSGIVSVGIYYNKNTI